jgi:cytochrome c oxidase subunit II
MERSRRDFIRTIAYVCAVPASIGTYVFARSVHAGEKVIRIRAKRFSYTPSTITLKKGEPAVLELTSEDVMMGFNLPDFKVRSDIVPGKTTRVRVVPDKTGTFVFLCDVFCGSGHENMNGSLLVVE